ncbi:MULTISPECIES: carbohydrate porin [unclassified Brenneria]|uniref:carbohydrate porin n=1 Tax=unclassified Brenneria TaxID=2634434 RepID=UPI0018F06DF0|nr:carbohydrate porin [Brenneria sp. L3-3C-1]MBJ7220342.1 carbohydrate porin [Brenneria sp. L3-3C-1]MEE3641587.1 carbohydrate porin [Brenneria sp. L3_3C_1]
MPIRYRIHYLLPCLCLLLITDAWCLSRSENKTSGMPVLSGSTDNKNPDNEFYTWLDDNGIYPTVLLRSKLFYSIDYGLSSGQNQLQDISLLALNLDVDLEKLLNIPSASFHLETENNFTRRNNAIGSSFGSFPLAQLPPNAPRRDVPVVSYTQRLFNDRVAVDMGRKNVTWYFMDRFAAWEGGSRMDSITWLTAPPPYATWMFQGRVDLGRHFYTRAGFWEYNVKNWGYDGWNFRTNGSSGTTSLFTLGYDEPLDSTLYPKHFEVVGYYVNAKETAPDTGIEHKGNRGFIISAGQVVKRFNQQNAETAEALYLYGMYGANLKPWNAAGVTYNATVGMAWTNAFGREGDTLGIKYNHTRLTKEKWQALDEANINSGGGGNIHGRDSAFIMLYGSFGVTRYLSVNPFIAYGFSPNTAYNPDTPQQPREGFFTGAVMTFSIGDLMGLPKFKHQ